MSKPDGWDWDISDYTDSHTGQTLYRVSVHDCRQPAAGNLSGFATSDAAEAAARKWISEKIGRGEVPKAVAPKLDRCESCESSVQQSIFVVNALMRAEVVDCDNYDSDKECDQAVNVMAHRSSLLAQLLRSYEDEREAIRLRQDPDYYTKAKHGD